MAAHPRALAKLLPIARWPTRDEAEASRWFSPIDVGAQRLTARTWIPAMVPWRATEDGQVTPEVLAWYRRFAEGEPGAIVVEATGIREIPSGPLLRIGHDRFLPGLRELVRVVREGSGGKTRLFIQLIDFLRIKRRPTREAFLTRFLLLDDAYREALGQADDAACRHQLLAMDESQLAQVLHPRDLESYLLGFRERVTDMVDPAIAELPRTLPSLFADAAARAQQAGFDGVELHAAHAYTLASFLSRRNTRTDGFGGSREERSRVPLRVLEAVRARTNDFTVGVRFLGDEAIEGGSDVEDAASFGRAFARAGADFLSISKGGKFEDARQPRVGHAAYPYTGPSGQECMPTVNIAAPGPWSRNVPLAARIRAVVREAGLQTPIIAAGGIASFQQAEAILESGQADIVASARQSLADPDWFKKVRLGRGEEVRRCLFTNYCEGLDQAHKSVTCQRWDRDFDPAEPGVTLSEDGRRRLTAPAWKP
jgi:2,4-dienoyl-CoA reductase-like NADH-dependent reductase (Old Yellow Enzyme family)